MEKVHREVPPALPSRRKGRGRNGLPLFPLAVLALFLALGGIVRAAALPVEARTQETWYAYTQEMAYDFTARVTSGLIYPSDQVRGEDLIRQRLPVEPPAYRRVLVPRLVQGLTLSFPYTFKADRSGEITATYRVDAVLSAPGYWQKNLQLLAPSAVTANGDQLDLQGLTVEVPLRQIIADMEKLQADQKLNYDQLELRVRPVVQISVAGQKEPLKAQLQPEFVLFLRDREAALEVEEPRVVREEKSFTVTTVTPMTVQVLGRTVKVSTLRMTSTVALGGFALTIVLLGLIRWLRRRSMSTDDLRQLGGTLITASHMEYPPDAVIVDVQSVHQLITLHMQTHRPVVRVGDECFLIDGTVCYRLRLGAQAS